MTIDTRKTITLYYYTADDKNNAPFPHGTRVWGVMFGGTCAMAERPDELAARAMAQSLAAPQYRLIEWDGDSSMETEVGAFKVRG